MKRQSGRHLNPDYYVEILSLPRKKLFTPTAIAHRKYDKKIDPRSFSKMFHALYRFSERNGLRDTPDNCVRHLDGTAVTENGVRQLLPGHRHFKWYGETWQKQFYDDDLPRFREYFQSRLVQALQQIAQQKVDMPHQVSVLPEEEPQEPLERPNLVVVKPEEAPLQLQDQPDPVIAQPKEEPMKAKLPKIKTKWLVMASVAMLLTATSLYNYNFLNEGYQVLRQDGPGTAVTYFQNRGESFENLFGQGWSAFRNGDYDEAEKLGKKVLESPADLDRARGNYLLGSLKSQQGVFEDAQEYLQTAEVLYGSLNQDAGVYQTRLLLSKMYLDLKDMDNARYYANLAEQNPNALQDEYYYYIQSHIAFFYNDYKTALDFALRREKVFAGDRSQLPSIYSEIGMFYGFLGNLDECLKFTIKAEGFASEQQNATEMMFNKINMCLYLKCSQKDYSDLRLGILTYSREKNEKRLQELVYYIDKFACPLDQAGSGQPPPPPAQLGESHPQPLEENREQ